MEVCSGPPAHADFETAPLATSTHIAAPSARATRFHPPGTPIITIHRARFARRLI